MMSLLSVFKGSDLVRLFVNLVDPISDDELNIYIAIGKDELYITSSSG